VKQVEVTDPTNEEGSGVLNMASMLRKAQPKA